MSQSYVLPKTLSEDVLRSTGIHIGLKSCTKDMTPYVFSRTPQEGFYLFNIPQTLEKINVAGKLIANTRRQNVVIYGAQLNHLNAINVFSQETGVHGFTGKLVAGTFSNPLLPNYTDVELLVVTDPQNRRPTKPYQDLRYDARVLQEARSLGIPIIGICDTDAVTEFVDIVIPANNKGSRAIATVFYLLTRAVLIASNSLKPEQELPYSIADYETMVKRRDDEQEDLNN